MRKYEEHRDKKYDNDLKLQRHYDVLPKAIEQQLVLEDRRVSDVRVSETESKQLDSDEFDGSSRHGIGGRRAREETTKTTMEEKRETGKGTVQWMLLTVWTVETHGEELRVDSRNVPRLWAVGTNASVVPLGR